MNTIKFEAWDSAYPLQAGTNAEKYAKTTALQEGEKVWHRPFQVKTIKEFDAWKKRFAWGATYTTSYIPGEDVNYAVRSKEKNDDSIIHFEYMTFYDRNGQLWKVIVFCCNCFIMNDAGQTVDKFSA